MANQQLLIPNGINESYNPVIDALGAESNISLSVNGFQIDRSNNRQWILDETPITITPDELNSVGAINASSFVLIAPNDKLFDAYVLTAGAGISILNQNLQSTVSVTGLLQQIVTLGTNGLMTKTNGGTITTRSFTSTGSLNITNPQGIAGDIIADVVDNTSVQKINVSVRGESSGNPQSTLNFTSDGSLNISATAETGRYDINLSVAGSGGGLAPANATYITQTPNTALTNEQALSLLASGILKVTTGTGILSTAVPGTDYQPGSAKLTSIANLTVSGGSLIVGNLDGATYNHLAVGTPGQILAVGVDGASLYWIDNGGGGGGAPINASYITKTPNGTLTNEFPLSTMSTGLMKVTTGTGNLTTAVAGTDYLAPSANLTSISALAAASGSLIVGNGSGFSELNAGTNGYVLTMTGGTPAWAPGGGGSDFVVATAQTLDATPTIVATIPVASNEVVGIDAYAVAITQDSANAGVFRFTAAAYNDGTTTHFVGYTTNDAFVTSGFTAPLTVGARIDSGNLVVGVSGQAATTINWSVKYNLNTFTVR